MSIQAVAWVMEESNTTGMDRLVLLSIANHANTNEVTGEYEAHPSVELIAWEVGTTRIRSVQKCVERLEASGHIRRVIQGQPDPRVRADRRTNLYTIVTDSPAVVRQDDNPPEHIVRQRERRAAFNGVTPSATPSAGERDDAKCHPVARQQGSRGGTSRPNGVTRSDTQTIREPIKQKTFRATPLNLVTDDTPLLPSGFDAFWARWPKKIAKEDARKAWKQVLGRGARDVQILEAVERWRSYWELSDTDPQFVPYPATWLRKGYWQTPPPEPRKQGTRAQQADDAATRALAAMYGDQEREQRAIGGGW